MNGSKFCFILLTLCLLLLRPLLTKRIIIDGLFPTLALDFDCHVDADFASLYSFEDLINPTCVKSRTGYVISIAGCPVSWISQLQTDIKSRTMEAEYNALSMTMKDVIPVQNLFPSASVGIGLDNITSSTFKTTVWEDNTGCLKLATFHPVNTLHDPSTMQ